MAGSPRLDGLCEPHQPVVAVGYPITTPKSQFRLYSNSKMVTNIALHKLFDAPGSKLDASKHLVQVAGPKNLLGGPPVDPDVAGITLEQLLNHGVRWNEARSNWDERAIQAELTNPAYHYYVHLPLSQEMVVRYLMTQPDLILQQKPQAYANLNYMLLGYAIGKLAPHGYRRFVRDDVFAAIGVPLDGPYQHRVEVHNWAASSADPTYYTLPHEVWHHDAIASPAPSWTQDDTVEGPVLVPSSYNHNPHTGAAHGGWVASAVDAVRLLAAFHEPSFYQPRLMSAATASQMWDRGWGKLSSNIRYHTGFAVGGTHLVVHDVKANLSWVLCFNLWWLSGPDPDGVVYGSSEGWDWLGPRHADRLMQIAAQVTAAGAWPLVDLWPAAGMGAIT